jgi:1-deoxy-D-xylulose-5-phosphate reductoisomerase
VLSAADEIAVDAFVAGRIGFRDIVRIVERSLEAHQPVSIDSLETLFAVDGWSREYASALVGKRSA